MKKLILLLFFISAPMFAQSLWWADTTSDGKEVKVFLGNYNKITGGIRHAPLPVSFPSESIQNTTVSNPYVTFVDSIKGADTSSYNFNKLYGYGYLGIKSSGSADTLVIEYKSTAMDTWTSQAIGFRDVYDNNLFLPDNTTVVIGAGLIKRFLVNLARPEEIRVRWKTNIGKSARNLRITFEGVNL
jgi:hypothetical protein